MPPKKKAAAAPAAAATKASAASPAKANTQTKAAASTQELPSKERAAFSSVMKLHDSKMYKKALKQADAILKKFPTHGETLAMKGLVLCNMNPTGDKSQAYSLIKQGLSYNLRSGVCWHVYGLIYRTDRKYADSVKCYQQALKITPDNQNVWKDLSQLQIQLRQYDGFVETRRKILTTKPNERTNWLAYAVGNHLLGLRGKALEILDAYEKAKGAQSREDTDAVQQKYEDSEMVLYRARVIEDSGDLQGALEYLQQNESKVVDKLSYKTKVASYYEQLQQHDKAVELYEALIAINPDNTQYHTGLRRAMKLDAAPASSSATTNGINHSSAPQHTSKQLQQLHTLYTDLANQYPRSSVIRRMPLTYLSGTHPDFKPRLDTYLQRGLRKNIPSLYSDLKPLYADAEKVEAITSLIEQYVQSLKASNKFSKDATQQEDASALLWTYVYAASHYDNQQQYDKALQYVEHAIQHTPTLLDLYQLKARIYKHAGDAQAAFHYMNTARLMDTQDRFLNTKTVRYAWRADKQAEAEQIVQLFLRDGDGLAALKDLQVIWYEIHAAEHYLRIGNTSKALKLLLQIDQHFIDMIEDQFDFHTYTLRKMTLRAYLDMLQWADQLRSHRYYFRAAVHLVKLYMQIHRDRQSKSTESTTTTTDNKPQTNGIHTKPAPLTTTAKDLMKEEDTDPNGDKLLADTNDPLAEATKFLKHLQHHCPERIETHLLAAELYTLRQKPLLVVKAIKCARAIDAEHPDVHTALIKLASTSAEQAGASSDSLQLPADSTLQTLFESELKALTDGQSAKALNAAYLRRHSTSALHRLAYAKSQLLIDPKAQTDAVQAVADATQGSNSASWQDAAAVYDFIKQHDTAAAERFKQQALKQYPLAAVFGAVNTLVNPIDTDQQSTDKQEVLNA